MLTTRSFPRTHSGLLALLLVLLGSPGDARPEERGFRLRLVPSRVVATVPWTEAATTTPAVSALRTWIRDARLTASGPAEQRFERKGRASFAPDALRIEVAHAERRLPAVRSGAHLVRLPAVLVLERFMAVSAETLSALPPPSAPPVEELAQRRLVWTGTHDRLLYPPARAGGPSRLYAWWPVTPKGRADVGLYADHGAHPNAVKSAAAACLGAGLSIRPLASLQVNDGSFAKHVRCVLMPGGWAEDFTLDIDTAGVKHLRAFVDRGGGYVGICAGAFYAASRITWIGKPLDYPLDLFDGAAIGPIEAVAAWPQHALATLQIDPSHDLGKGLSAPRRPVFYLGGPWFKPEGNARQRVGVVARYADSEAPAIITLERKRGRVFLSGVHLEYDLTSDRDDIDWPENEGKLKDPEADWDLFQRGVVWAVGKRR